MRKLFYIIVPVCNSMKYPDRTKYLFTTIYYRNKFLYNIITKMVIYNIDIYDYPVGTG